MAVLVSLPAAADWPMYRHDPTHTNATTGPVPTNSELLWSYTPELPTDFYAHYNYLAVADDLVFWTGVTRDETHWWESLYTGVVKCFDANSGDPVWSRELRNSMRSPTIVDGRLYLTANYYDSYYGTSSGGVMACWDADTGNSIWSRSLHAPPSGHPVVADGVVLTATYRRLWYDYLSSLVALDADTGYLLWEHDDEYVDRIFIAPSVASGRVYAGWHQGYEGMLVCYDLHSGEVLWQSPYYPEGRSTVCDDVVVYLLSSGPHAFSTLTGDMLWARTDLDASSVAYADGSVFVADDSDQLLRLDKDSGSTQWNVSIGNHHAPTIAGNYLYLVGEDVFCIDGTDGETLCCAGGASAPFSAQLDCSPSLEPPFDALVGLSLTNLAIDGPRRYVYQVNLTDADGSFDLNWHRGWQNVQAGDTWTTSWTHGIPGLEGNWGTALFELEAIDVTPAPYNQPPYLPAGDTATDLCTITASEAP